MAFSPAPKNPGDLIRSLDWNEAMGEVVRLESAKLSLTGGNVNGPLSVSTLSIGTATPPNRALTVRGTAGTYLNVIANNGTHEVLLGADNAGGIVSTMTNHDLQLRAGGNVTRLTVKADGNVGIGTPMPSASLEVVGSSWERHLRLTNTTTDGAGPGIFFNAVNRDWAILGTNATASAGDQKLGFYDATSNQYRMVIDAGGNVGIRTTAPGFALDVADRVRIRQGPSGTAGLWMYQSGLNADAAFIGMASNTEVGFWGNTGAGWGVRMETTTSTLQVLASSNPLYFTNGWRGFPDAVTNAAEISNDTGTYRTLMLVGNRSFGLGRRVSVWDRFEVNGTFVNNSSIEAKQDVQALSEEDYRDLHHKLMATPLYRYRFKASGIDQKVRLGVIAEESPSEILDETGKYVSFLDYVGFLYAALKAQASEINRLARLIGANTKSDAPLTSAHV